jgi:hypothetical protein
MHIFHKWSKWESETGVYHSPLFPRLGTWTEPIQIRECEKCGKTKIRKVRG